MYRYIIFGIVFFNCAVNAQSNSWSRLSFEELIANYNKESLFEKKEELGEELVKKAKTVKNTSWLISGYHLLAVLYQDVKVLKYSDSIITLSKDSEDKYYPATAYLIKGIYYYDKRNFQDALDNYLTANQIARKHHNEDLILKTNYCIGILKDRIGESHEALKIHKENFAYTKKNIPSIDKTDYLLSIFALANTFNDLKILDSASFYNRLGIKESIKFKNVQEYNHFVLNEGSTLFYKKKYKAALDSIKKSMVYFEKISDKPNMAVGYYYLGKSYHELGKTEESLFYFKKVDTVFRQNQDLLPKLRESYEHLINFYKQKNEMEQQLTYVNQLMKLDSILYNNEIYLNRNITREYDVPKLISEKERIISSLNKQKKKFTLVVAVISLLVIISFVLFYHYYIRQRTYKKRLEILIAGGNKQNNSAEREESIKMEMNAEIPDETVKSILKNLEVFETQKGYLAKNISLKDLAKHINTNTKYLSKTINIHKRKSFNTYINDLRIDYTVFKLREEKKLLDYTVTALAREMGFKNSEVFSKAFYKRAGLYPSFLIKELQKQKNG